MLVKYIIPFVHIPTREDVRELISRSGLDLVADCERGQIARESAKVREFTPECRFWVARRPGAADQS